MGEIYTYDVKRNNNCYNLNVDAVGHDIVDGCLIITNLKGDLIVFNSRVWEDFTRRSK